MTTTGRRALALSVLSFAALLTFSSAPGWAVTEGCAAPAAQLNKQFAALSVGGNKGQLSEEEQQKRRLLGGELYAAAVKAHPQCEEDFATIVTQVTAIARSQTAVKGDPFLGPIGWLWNNVYYRVFSGNDVMMVLFGWSLLLSPVILVVSIIWVMQGARGALRKPYVPENLRADL